MLSAVLSGCSGDNATDSSTNSPPPDKVTAKESPRFEFTMPERREAENSQVAELQFPFFTVANEDVDLQLTYSNGTSARQLMVESTGTGIGWLDFDLDDRMDIYFPQGGEPDASEASSRPPNQLLRQLPSGNFSNIASLSGVLDHGYGQGVSVADLDNDGFPDLLVTNVGRNQVFHNNGDGTYSSVRDQYGFTESVWSTASAWGDLNRDGNADVYICNYAQYDPYHPIPCVDESGAPTICHPRNVSAEPDHYYQNTGASGFKRKDVELGITGKKNRGLAVVVCDLDRDGWQDFYVANDTTANFLFLNRAGERFDESAMGMGGAFNANGGAQASMGIGVADYDENGFLDLCLTHFSGEYNTLYQNLGPSGLRDSTSLTGLRDPTLPKLAFGVLMQDFNADGSQDLIFANGHIDPIHPDGEGYEMTPQCLSFDGLRWQDGSKSSGSFFSQKAVARGLAMADFDNDQDPDLLCVRQNGPTVLLRNESKSGRLIRIKLIGTSATRNAFGTKVTLTAGPRILYNEVITGTGYASAHEHVLQFGLGTWEKKIECLVQWPNGTETPLDIPDNCRELTLIEGRRPILNES